MVVWAIGSEDVVVVWVVRYARLVFLRAATVSLRTLRCVGFVERVGGVVVDVGGFDVRLVVTDVDGFDGTVECAAERVVRVIVGAGMGLVERVRRVVGFEVDVDGPGVSTPTIISCSSAD